MWKWHWFYLNHLLEFSSESPASIPFGECISYFCVTGIKIPNLYKEGTLILAHGFRRLQFIMVKKARQRVSVCGGGDGLLDLSAGSGPGNRESSAKSGVGTSL